MDEREAILAELVQMREGAAALMRARLDTAANQIRELATRVAGDLGVVIPPDLETLFPLTSLTARLEELAKPAPLPPAVTLELLRRLDAGRAQSEVLQELLRQLETFCGPRGIVVFRDGAAAGWAGAGFANGDPVRTWRGSLTNSAALARVASGTPALSHTDGDSVLAGWMGSTTKVLLVPMSLRGKVVGALIAGEGETGLDTVTVQHLTFTAGLLLETLNVRPTIPTAALLDPVDMTLPAVAAAEAEPVFAPPAEEEPLPLEQPTVPPGEAMPGADAGATAQIKIPVTPPPPPPAVAARPPDEERKHEEAKRFARLLVSEIRLYNEQAVQVGKNSHDIYQRLREDIDRSREMYEQRVATEVRAHSNYFFDELVRILADGDQDALGL